MNNIVIKGAAALADYVHRAIHSKSEEPGAIRAALAGQRLVLMERTLKLAQARHDMAHTKQARQRWHVTAEFLRDELRLNRMAYSAEPVREQRNWAKMPVRRRAPRRKGR